MQISEFIDKTASNLAIAPLDDDSYHVVIKNAAIRLQASGKGHLRYQTQYSSGTTLWKGAGELVTMLAAYQPV